jgi:hypothetical protein
LAIASSNGPTQQSKLSQPGASGFSSSAALVTPHAKKTTPNIIDTAANRVFIIYASFQGSSSNSDE